MGVVNMIRRISNRVLSLVLFSAVAAVAGEPTAAPAGSSLLDIFQAGGWTMYVILLLSVGELFFTFYFFFVLREQVLYPRRLVRELQEMATHGDVAALQEACKANDTVLTRVLAMAFDQLRVDPRADFSQLNSTMEEEGSRQATLLWQKVQYLLDIAVVAPMVGLLGTVLGMLQAFAGLRAEIGAVIPTAIASGISTAMITTAYGLMVGIPAMLLYAFFRNRVFSLVAGLEGTCGRILRELHVALNRTARGKL
jgi:biopolymer transport protein ExbB